MFGHTLEHWDDLKSKLTSTIIENRTQYATLTKTIMTFVQNTPEVILSDRNTLVGAPDKTKLEFAIYCKNPHALAMKLIDALYRALPADQGNWLELKTALMHEELNIVYDNIWLVSVNRLNINKAQINFIKSVTIANALYLPPEIELIDLYHTLYDPDKAGEWEDAIQLEDPLFQMFKKRYDDGIITGGESKCPPIPSNTLKQLIVQKILPNNNIILIGDWAMKLMQAGLEGKPVVTSQEKLQIIIETPIDTLMEYLSEYTQTLSYRKQDVRIPKDIRLTKYTIYNTDCNQPGGRPIIDVYTAASYELIPWVNSTRFMQRKNKTYPRGIKIGNPFVLLRFFMIDVWILRYLYDQKLIVNALLIEKINLLFSHISQIRSSDFMNKIEGGNYMGKYISYTAYKKNQMKQQQTSSYFPGKKST